MGPIVKTILWILAAITPLVVAAGLILHWTSLQENQAAQAEADRSAQAAARIVELTVGVANQQLEGLADSPALEESIERRDFAGISAELALFQLFPAWRSVRLVGPDGRTLASSGQFLASDLEEMPRTEGVVVEPARGLEPARALISRQVQTRGVKTGWLIGSLSLRSVEAALASSPDQGITLLTRRDGTLVLGKVPASHGPVEFHFTGLRPQVHVAGEILPAAVVPVLEGSAQIVNVQGKQAYARSVSAPLATLGITALLLATAIVAWRVRLRAAEDRLLFRERELLMLQELATDATVSTSREKVIRMAGARLTQLVGGIDETWVALAVAARRTRVQLFPTYPTVRDPVDLPVDGNLLLSRVLQHGHRESGRSVVSDESWLQAGFGGAAWESWTPLAAHGRILGAIACLSAGGRRELNADEQRLLDGIAATLAVALESHERLSELSQHRTMLATVLDSTPDALLALSAEGRILVDNPAARALLRSPQELVGNTLGAVIEGARRQGATFDFDYDPAQLIEESRTGKTTRGSFRLRFDDATRDLESMMAPLPLPEGQQGTLISLRDVSTRAELEQVRLLHEQVTLLAREAAGRAALLEQVLAASEAGMAFLDHEGRALYSNQRFADLFGIPPPERGAHESQLEEAVGARVESGFVDLHSPAILHTRKPSPRILAMRSVEVQEPSGRVLGRLISVRDETSQRELEAARESFIGVAAHELKNPLAVLRLQAEMGLRDLRRAPDALRRIVDRTRELQELIDGLLDVTRAELNRLNLHCSEVEVMPLVREAIEPFLAQHAAIELAGDERVRAQADPVRLRQVVVNLLSNAVRYGGEGKIDVSVDCSGGAIRIAVRDHGPGIPAEDRAHIFERFGQGRSASRGPGLGLGLYLSQRIAEAHGGRIELESEVGAGSTFALVLPAERRTMQPEPYGAGMQAAT